MKRDESVAFGCCGVQADRSRETERSEAKRRHYT
jgi:hypothetical protein